MIGGPDATACGTLDADGTTNINRSKKMKNYPFG